MAPSITEPSPAAARNPDSSPGDRAVVAPSPGTEPAAASADPAPSPDPRRVILVVDDQASVCTAVAYYLEMCGYKTFRAESGPAALAIFGREQIDGVLMDVQMPQMNGFEASKRLHALAASLGRQPKVWFMTAVHYREAKDDCTAAGGLCVFQKPFDWPQLLAELGRVLNPAPSGSVRQTPDTSPAQA
jgi:CheY-like chemotaxis protein